MPQFLTHLQNRTLWPEKLRGRVCHEAVVQVAEPIFLRQQTAVLPINALQHTATHLLSEGVWQVQFQAQDGQLHTVTVETAEPLTTYPSSGSLKAKNRFPISLHPVKREAQGLKFAQT